MEIKLNRKEFLKKIQIVENAISEDKANGEKSRISLETKDDTLVLKGVGDGLSIKAVVNCDVIEHGEFVIKHKLMEEFIKQLEEEEFKIKKNNDRIYVSAGKSSSEFSIFESEKRNIQQVGLGVEYEFDRIKLLNDIENVKFAASTDISKEGVNCIRLELEDNKIKYVASDSYRLIHMSRDIELKIEESISVSVPLRAINSLSKILRILDDENVIFKTDGTRILFRFKDVEIVTKLVETKYPDYKGILETFKYDKLAKINVKDLIGVLKRISVFVRDNKNRKDVALLKFGSNILEITGKNDLLNAEIKESLNTIYEGKDLKIGLNIRYILEYLSTLEDEIIEIKLFDDKKPILLNIDGKEDSVYLVAPTTM